MHKAGERVYAILSADPTLKVLKVLGEGVFEGNEVPGLECGGFGADLRSLGVTNPKIRLDSGEVVWGCECWWGKIEGAAAMIEDYRKDGWEIRTVSIVGARDEALRLKKPEEQR